MEMIAGIIIGVLLCLFAPQAVDWWFFSKWNKHIDNNPNKGL